MCYTHTARVCVQNFTAVRHAVSEEIADRRVSQLSIIIFLLSASRAAMAERLLEIPTVRLYRRPSCWTGASLLPLLLLLLVRLLCEAFENMHATVLGRRAVSLQNHPHDRPEIMGRRMTNLVQIR